MIGSGPINTVDSVKCSRIDASGGCGHVPGNATIPAFDSSRCIGCDRGDCDRCRRCDSAPLSGSRNGEVVRLLELLFSSAVLSLGVGGLFVWVSAGRRWNRLATRLVAAHAVGIIVIMVNIVIAAYAMFISSHDLSHFQLLLVYSVAIAAIYSVLVSSSIGDSLGASGSLPAHVGG